MKRIFALIGFIIAVLSVSAQQSIETSSVNFKLGDDEYQGIQVLIPEADFKLVEKMWIKVLERGTKSKVAAARNGEYSIFGAYLKALGDDPVNIYCQIIPRDTVVILNSCIELKRNVFLTEDLYESEFNQLGEFMKEFSRGVYIDVVSEQVKTEDMTLKELNKELKKLQNEKEDIEKNIANDEHEIQVSEDHIVFLNGDIAVKNEEIAQGKVRMNTAAKDPEQKAAVKEALRKTEKEKRNLQQDVKKEKKKIVEYESNIDNAKLDIPSLDAELMSIREKIEMQNNNLRQLETKLQTIKNF